MLFEPNYNMLIELDKLEKLMPKYAEVLRYLSLKIRNNIWVRASEKHLAKFLHACNWVFSVLVDTFGEDIIEIEMYVDILFQKSDRYSTSDFTMVYQEIKTHIAIYKTQDMVKEHWRQINPYFRPEFSKEDLFDKNIIEILDDLFVNTVDVYPQEFYVTLDGLVYLHRGRRGKWSKPGDFFPPSIEFAKQKNIINRWNPSDKRYLYLAASHTNEPYSQSICLNEFVCLEEMRIKANEEVSLAQFRVVKQAKRKTVINLDYENIKRADIFEYIQNEEKRQVTSILERILEQHIQLTESNIKQLIDEQSVQTKQIASVFCGKLLLKEISKAIFVPLDDNEDNDPALKDQCYKSFHIMAEYLELKGIAGIVYPSTQMNKHKDKGLKGSNVVLFEVNDAEPLKSTIKTIMGE